MDLRNTNPTRNSRGQSLVETALMLPVLVLLVLNVVNLGYFFLVIVNLTGAARTATLYAIEGGATPAGGVLPTAGGSTPTTSISSVTYLAYQDLTGALWNPTGVTVQVCSQSNLDSSNKGVNTDTGSVQRPNCETCTSGSGCTAAGDGTPVPDPDPEANSASCTAPGCSGIFLLNQVRITYQFNTLIPGTIFNIPLQASAMCNSGTCTFTRTAEMRAMN